MTTQEQRQKIFEDFKLSVELLHRGVSEAEDFKDVTIILENAFQHPLYQESRVRFAGGLATAIASGIFSALE